MRPEAVLHWLATVTPSSIEELGLLMNSLLWELSERGFAIIDTSHLQMVFSPLISAAKEQLHAELQRHRLLISAKYGENASSAFGEAPDVSLPIVMESYFAQMSQQLEQTVAIQQAQLEELGRREVRIEAVRTSQSAITGSGRLSDAERAELERLRAEKQSRADKNARRKRRSSSKRRK
jgi:septal ring factor EnvC (AmiA/AmiB activator)